MWTVLVIAVIVLLGGVAWWMARRASADRLAGAPLSVSSHEVAAENPSFEAGGIRFVEVSRSPNGRFLAGRTELTADGKPTRVAVADLRIGKVVFSVRLKLANHPMVDNEGTLVVEELHGEGASSSALMAFRAGRRIWLAPYDARIFSSGMSDSGTQVYACTGESRNPMHSGKTFVYETRTGRLVRHFTGWDDVIRGGKFPGTA